MRDRLNILVAGMVAGVPHQAGATWAVLQYVLGLRRLGHEVVLVEPVPELTPASVRYFRDVMREFGLEESAALLVSGTQQTAGASYERLRAAARGADLLLNVSGMLAGELAEAPQTRVYLDLDPAFNQLWHAVEGIDMGFGRHERFVTVGLSLGDDECPVPTCGLDWITTPQPVVLDHWPAAPANAGGPVTTVANFRGYGSVEWDGTLYGQKVHSLRELFPLPGRTAARLVLAMAIDPDERSDLEALARHGWELADPRQVAGTPGDYAAFLRASAAELGIAKSGYVRSRCGWFSDRSACYLASARPVVAQETGFSAHLPTGEGLLAFTGVDDAADALAHVGRDPARHARAARAIAEEIFDSDRVLRALLERLA